MKISHIYEFDWCVEASHLSAAERLLTDIFWWERTDGYPERWDAIQGAGVALPENIDTIPTTRHPNDNFVLCWIAALQNDWGRWEKVLDQWPNRPALLSQCLDVLEAGRKRQYKRMATLLDKTKANGVWPDALMTVAFTALEQSGVDARPLLAVLTSQPVATPLACLLTSRLLAADGKREQALSLLDHGRQLWPKAGYLPWFEATLLAQGEILFSALKAMEQAEALGITDIALLRFRLSALSSLPRDHPVADIRRIYEQSLCWLVGDSRRSAEMTAYLLIRYWMDGNLKEIHRLLQVHHAFQDMPERKEDKAARAFMQLVVKLCIAWQQNRAIYPDLHQAEKTGSPPVPVLYVMGESHCLVPCNTVFYWQGAQRVAVPVFVMGAKMWHFAKQGDSLQKTQLHEHLNSLPKGAHLLVAVGEIDCRPDEGLWSVHKKTGRSLQTLIRTTIRGYLDYLAQTLADIECASLVVQGIPAPTEGLLNALQARERAAFVDMIRRVNVHLKAEVLAMGWKFLDVHAATANQEGKSNEKWHIDNVHLHPLFYQEASSWLVSAAEDGAKTPHIHAPDASEAGGSIANMSAQPDAVTCQALLALYQKGDYAASRLRAEQLVQQFPSSSLCWQVLGAALQAQGEQAAALAAKLRAVELAPDDAQAQNILARSLLEARNPADAASAAKRAISLAPDYADAHATLGRVLKAEGKKAEAEKSLRQATDLAGAHPEYWNDLGLLLYEMGRIHEAREAFQRATALRPDYADAFNNLGLACNAAGQPGDAVQCYRRALESAPEHAAAHNNLAVLCQRQGDLARAESHFRAALKIRPDYLEALANLGGLLKNKGDNDEAIRCFTRLLQIQPDHATARHLLQSLTHQTSETAPPEYVARLFDDYAENFDEALVGKLQYQTPRRLANAVQQHHQGSRRITDILDLGCGTGLAGVEFHRPETTVLVGVDLSAKMLEKANARGVYQRLVNAELLEMMHGEPDTSYDLIVAADVFVYIGKLDEILAQGHRLLRPGGIFAFSVEAMEVEDMSAAAPSYLLNPTGRYSHSQKYLENLCQNTGYSPLLFFKEKLRIDQGKAVMGWLVLLAKLN